MTHPPTLSYKGLLIVMSQPSRFDTAQLLSGSAGSFFNEECLRPGINRWQAHITTCDDFNQSGRILPTGTKVVLALGNRAQKELLRSDVTLNELRGSPVIKDGIVYISSYLPQDCFDFKGEYEERMNPHLNGTLTVEDDPWASDEDDDGDEKSRHGKTNRTNYRYWLKRDTKKAFRILTHGLTTYEEPTYEIYPSSGEVIETLRSNKEGILYLDLETTSDLSFNCFGFSFDNSPKIYVVPIIRYDYSLAYSNCGSILRSLAYAMEHNTTVAHNGANFDWFVCAHRYGLPVGHRLYDTMIAHHRCFPEVEKSLGHCLSNFTDLPYHKDEGCFEPQSGQAEEKLWMYNGKDVYSMKILKRAIDAYASGIKGLPESIAAANRSIRPYLISTLQGIRYRKDKVKETLALNDRWLNQLQRVISCAIGQEYMKYVRGSSDKAMAGSPSQCVRYFHDICGFPVQGYGKVTKTGKRNPSLNEKNFLKLAIKHEHPLIDVVLKYRELAKESGTLKFVPWKEND